MNTSLRTSFPTARRAGRAARRGRPSQPWLVGAAMVAPSLLVFLGFVAVPVVVVALTSLTHWTGFELGDISWAGIDNYSGLVGDPIFWKAFRQTLIFTIGTTLLLNLVGFGLAHLVNTRVRGSGFLKAVLFLPVLMSPVIVGLMWSNLLRGSGGGLNELLSALGIIHDPIFFLGDPNYALAAVIVATVWQFAGYDMILYYAGLQGVPDTLLEAAALDGASRWGTIRHVVLPSLYPVMSVVVLLNVIGGLRVFDVVYVMTRGGPDRHTEVLATYMYEQGFSLNAMGMASAIAMVIVVLAVTFSVIRMRGARRAG